MRYLIDVDEAEHATILAALRTYQEAGYGEPENRPERIHMIATNCDTVMSSLNDEAIDDLCLKVNTCDTLAVSTLPTKQTKGNQQNEEDKRRGSE